LFGCHLAGGDTDRTGGALSISTTAFGTVPTGRMVRRTTAKIGDYLFVTGTLGDAALGLEVRRAGSKRPEILNEGERQFLVSKYLRPTPPVALAPAVRAHASAALDISDGFVKDVSRLTDGAGGGADIAFDKLPLSDTAKKWLAVARERRRDVLSGGGDYEIVCAVPPERHAPFLEACAAFAFRVTEIGVISDKPGVRVLGGSGEILDTGKGGHDHFS